MSCKRILLADDHEEFLLSIKGLLLEKYEVVGAVQDGDALVAAAKAMKPDLIVSDVSMPVMSGLQAAVALRDMGLSIDIIFLTIHASAAYAKKAMSIGAKGYVLKIYAHEQLLTAIEQVLAGGRFISPEIPFKIAD